MFGFDWLTSMCIWYVATDPFDDDEEEDIDEDMWDTIGDTETYEILEEDDSVERGRD